MIQIYSQKRFLCPLIALIFIVGCGNEYDSVPVTGTVILDGEPVPDCLVIFEPIAPEEESVAGPSSSGVTDSQGMFELKMMFNGQVGAKVGKHRVRISNAKGKIGPNGGHIVDEGTIPGCYHTETILTYEVKAGEPIVADFSLKKEGE